MSRVRQFRRERIKFIVSVISVDVIIIIIYVGSNSVKGFFQKRG